jgi:hypothetical protein
MLATPEVLKPPKGTCGASFTEEQLMWQLPVSRRFISARPRVSLPVTTPPESPYSVPLAICTASSSVRNGMTGTTGPKVSSW